MMARESLIHALMQDQEVMNMVRQSMASVRCKTNRGQRLRNDPLTHRQPTERARATRNESVQKTAPLPPNPELEKVRQKILCLCK